MYTLSHMVGAPYDFESLIVFAPIVTCWKITTFRPICADLVINIPLTPCGRISGDSMWASMLMLAARLVMYRFQTSAFHRAFFMWYDLYRRQILRLYINVPPPSKIRRLSEKCVLIIFIAFMYRLFNNINSENSCLHDLVVEIFNYVKCLLPDFLNHLRRNVGRGNRHYVLNLDYKAFVAFYAQQSALCALKWSGNYANLVPDLVFQLF